jgi:outer membrane protein assembly factor BamE (lipoprotein component of BamABCDE complex)
MTAGLRTKVLRTALLFLTLAVAAVGCVTNGKDFRSDVAWIKKGTTNKKEVSSLLGEPYSVGNSGGKETWTYGYYRYKMIGKSSQKELKFYWNPDGTVNDYAFNSSFPGDTGHGSSEPVEPVGP